MLSAQSSQVYDDKLYVDDVFSAYTYDGKETTSSNYTPNIITNGINLATSGGLVWVKNRSIAIDNVLYDTVRGVGTRLSSNTSAAQSGPTQYGVTSFNNNGFTVADTTGAGFVNATTYQYSSWTFRKAPKFFDVVTYTGNSGDFRSIPHSLGISPGLVIIKDYSFSDDWHVYHANAAGKLVLNTTAAQDASGRVGIKSVSSTSFTVSDSDAGQNRCNALGSNYVAYLFAHDTSTDGLIQCGSYVGTGAYNPGPLINLGWEPQYVMIKRVDNVGGWVICDTARGMRASNSRTNAPILFANSSQGENTSVAVVDISSNGFNPNDISAEVNGSGATYIYMAIRRPNKPPTVGTQVYKGLLHSATQLQVSKTGVGFAPDVFLSSARTQSHGKAIQDRLRGANRNLLTHSSGAEVATTQAVLSFDIDGVTLGSDDPHQFNYGGTYVEHFFKRAPGVFDVVCYTGTGAARTVPHGLGVVPELMIMKSRTQAGYGWWVYPNDPLKYLELNRTDAFTTSGSIWNSTAPTNSVFTINNYVGVNNTGSTYVAYLFATKAGISKVGTYTGNGSSQTINCGFTTGARFALIKRTDNTGDWFVWDTARGIVAGTDPHLSLNTNAAEVTSDDSIDPDTSGFIVNQVAATGINVTDASYIFLSFA